MSQKCKIEGCKSVRGPNMSLFKVPFDKPQREKWIAAIERHQPFNYYLADFPVCQNHFRSSDYYKSPFTDRKFLARGVIPTIFPERKVFEPPKRKRKLIKIETNDEANDCEDVAGVDLTNLFEVVDPDSIDPLAEKSAKIVRVPHHCQKSIDLELELKKVQEKMKQLQQKCNEKSNEITRLNRLVRYYQNRSKPTKSKELSRIRKTKKNEETINH